MTYIDCLLDLEPHLLIQEAPQRVNDLEQGVGSVVHSDGKL